MCFQEKGDLAIFSTGFEDGREWRWTLSRYRFFIDGLNVGEVHNINTLENQWKEGSHLQHQSNTPVI